MRAKDVMTREVECVEPTVSLKEAAARMRALDVGALPVCVGNRPLGMITDRDIALRAVAEGHDPNVETVEAAMTPELICVLEDSDVLEVAQIMRDRQVRRLPVLDRSKHLVGIISLGDVAIETRDNQLSGDALRGISEPALAAH